MTRTILLTDGESAYVRAALLLLAALSASRLSDIADKIYPELARDLSSSFLDLDELPSDRIQL